MNFEEFQTQMISEMRDYFPDLIIGTQDVSKVQGQSYSGISIRQEDSPVGAAINLEQFYERLQDGIPMETLTQQVADHISAALENMPHIDIDSLADYQQMRESLTLQLIPIKGNEDKLADIPHRNIEDIALVYRFELAENEAGVSNVLITNAMLKSYGIDAEQLHTDAVEAATWKHPATLRNMTDVMQEMMGNMGFDEPVQLEPSPIWVASIEGGMNGAAAIQYPGFLESAVDTMGGNFFILPSSVHEVLFLPESDNPTLDELEGMVRSINQDEVLPEDRLSDTVYHYDSQTHLFETARNYEARISEHEEELVSDEVHSDINSETIKVLRVEPNEYPKVVEIGTNLEALQAEVGGDIEVVYPFEDNVGLIVNEEGKLLGLPLNRALRDSDGEIYDVMAGPFIVAGLTEESFGSLTEEQIGKYESLFHQPEAFLKMGKGIMAIPIPNEVVKDIKEAGAQFGQHTKDSGNHNQDSRSDR